MKQKHFIDSHKGATAPAVLLLIWYFGQWENATAWIYLAIHGTYGIMWVLKSTIFPDKPGNQSAPSGMGSIYGAGSACTGYLHGLLCLPLLKIRPCFWE